MSVLVIAKTIKHVQCEKCGTEFDYELARQTGKTYHGFALNEDHADEKARRLAEQELQERLASESDLVRCPHCRHINAQLQQEYALTRAREKQKLWALAGGSGLLFAFMLLLGFGAGLWRIKLILGLALSGFTFFVSLILLVSQRNAPPVISPSLQRLDSKIKCRHCGNETDAGASRCQVCATMNP